MTNITGTLKLPNGNAIANGKVTLTLLATGYAPGSIYAKSRAVSATADAGGGFSLTVWPNTTASNQCPYQVDIYDNHLLIDSFSCYVPDSPTSISLDALRDMNAASESDAIQKIAAALTSTARPISGTGNLTVTSNVNGIVLAVTPPPAGDSSGLVANTGFVADSLAAHTSSIDPHSQYLTAVRGNALYDATGAAVSAVAGHNLATDPHQQYLTTVRAGLLYDPLGAATGSMTSHTAATNPHNQYAKLVGPAFTGGLSITGQTNISNSSGTANSVSVDFFNGSGSYGIGMGPTANEGTLKYYAGMGNGSNFGHTFLVNGTERFKIHGDGVITANGKTVMALDSSGNNANGYWWRYSDGLQICELFYGLAAAAPTIWTFPSGFSQYPSISMASVDWPEGLFSFRNCTPSAVTVVRWGVNGTPALTVYPYNTTAVSIIAMGRWK